MFNLQRALIALEHLANEYIEEGRLLESLGEMEKFSEVDRARYQDSGYYLIECGLDVLACVRLANEQGNNVGTGYLGC